MTDTNDTLSPALTLALAEIERLRARVIALEAALAVASGSLAQPTPSPDEPMTIVHDVPPSAPPHGE